MRSYLFIGFCIGALASASASGAVQKGSVEVATLTGPSDLINSQKKHAPLSRGLSFQEGNRVETREKSMLELVLSNGSTLKVSPGTLMEVKTFSQVASPLIVPGKYQELSAEPSPSVVQIEVYRGKIEGEVRKLNPNTQYTIKTPVGVVRIRGTVLSVAYSEDQYGRGFMRVTCTNGSVSIYSNSNGSTTIIGPGEQFDVVGQPDNVALAPSKGADLNNDGAPDVVIDSNGDGKADGVDVNGDGKPDRFVSTRPDGRLDAIDLGDGKPPVPLVDAAGNPLIAIDANGDGVPEAIVSANEGSNGFVLTPLTYPPAYNSDGKLIVIEPVKVPEQTQTPPPSNNLPSSDPTTEKVIQKSVQQQLSPSGS